MIDRIGKTFLRYLRAPVARTAAQFGDDIEAEIAFHIAERTSENLAAGMNEEEAQRKALQQFGDISRVAAECQQESLAGLAAWHRMHMLATVTLAVFVGVLWFRSLMPGGGNGSQKTQLPPGLAAMLDHDWSGDVTGQVLDDRGNPIGNAHLLVVVKTWPDESYFQRAYVAISDADGRFSVENVYPLNERYAVQVAAVAEDHVLQSSYHRRVKGALDPLTFELPTSVGFELIVESEAGLTLEGVEVLPHGRVEADGDEHIVYFDSAQPIVRITGADGRVPLPYFRPGEKVTLMLRVPQGDWKSYEIIAPAQGSPVTVRTSARNENSQRES